MFKWLFIGLFQTLTFNQKEYCVRTNSGFKCDFVEKQKTEFFISEELLEEHINQKYHETLFLKEVIETTFESDSVYSITAVGKECEANEEYYIINISKTGNKLQIFRYYLGKEERWTFIN